MKIKQKMCLVISIAMLAASNIPAFADDSDGTLPQNISEGTDVSLDIEETDHEEVPREEVIDDLPVQWVDENGDVYDYFEAKENGLIPDVEDYDIEPYLSITIEIDFDDVSHNKIASCPEEQTYSDEHTVMVNEDGTVSSWGANKYGQLGNGTKTNSTLPVNVSGLTDIIDVCAGHGFSLALNSDGEVYAWGRNTWGMLGSGDKTNYLIPHKVTGLEGVKIVKISTTGFHCLALASNGEVYSWGVNANGQAGLGDGDINPITPTLVPELPACLDISAGEFYSVAVDWRGNVWSWGSNFYCRLGFVGSQTASPYKTDIKNIEKISAGYDHCMAIDDSGKLYAWGSNTHGALGNNIITTNTAQPQLIEVDDVSDIYTGSFCSVAKTIDGNVYYWGCNEYGQGGINSADTEIHNPTLINSTNFITVGLGMHSSYALDESYNLYKWGYMPNKYINGYSENVNAPVDIPLGSKFVQIDSRRNGNVAVNQFGEVYVWGDASFYDLGLASDNTTITYPQKVEGLPKIKMIAKGKSHVLALDYDGNVWGWGNNSSGEVELGNSSKVATPIKLAGLTDITAISAGEGFSAAITSNGDVLTWGNNSVGQLGYDTGRKASAPTKVTGLSNVSIISCGETFMTALAGNTLYTWGNNNCGQLGVGTDTTYRALPEAVEGQYKYVSSQRDHVLAIGTDNKIYAWGRNSVGQLGNGDKTTLYSPTLISSNNNYSDVIAGYSHSMAIGEDGCLYTWGSSYNGQLGFGNYDSVRVPTKLSALSDMKAITAGGDFSMVTNKKYNLFAFGNNTSGQLGLTSYVPQKLGVEYKVHLFENAEDISDNYVTNDSVFKTDEIHVFKFVPNSSETYNITTKGDVDAVCTLYDADMNLIAYDDDSNGGVNFSLSYDFNEGETYYICTEYQGNTSGEYKLYIEKDDFDVIIK